MKILIEGDGPARGYFAERADYASERNIYPEISGMYHFSPVAKTRISGTIYEAFASEGDAVALVEFSQGMEIRIDEKPHTIVNLFCFGNDKEFVRKVIDGLIPEGIIDLKKEYLQPNAIEEMIKNLTYYLALKIPRLMEMGLYG